MVLLEAAAYGRCIIATDCAANRAVLDDGALYFKGDGVDELAGQISRCFNSGQLRRDFAQRAKAFVEANYSWSSTADRFEAIYACVVRPR